MDYKKLLGGILIGGILLIIAAYLFIAMDSFGAKWVGGGIVGLIGVIIIIGAFVKSTGKSAPAPMETPVVSTPEPSAPAEPEAAPEAAPASPEQSEGGPTEEPPASQPMQ